MSIRAAGMLACVSLPFILAQVAAAEDSSFSADGFRYSVHSGERIAAFCERLQEEGVSSSDIFLRIASTAQFPGFPFVPAPRQDVNRFEGLFVPGQYTLALGFLSADGLSDTQKLWLTKRMIAQLLEASARRLKGFHSRVGLGLSQSITLASIVEKEAVNGKDYGKIASVFCNRLRTNTPLASCPAVEYFLGYHRPYLQLSDILTDSPYNLYMHPGLPPTPIAFFTDAAFRSVMDPPDTSYQFFVFDWARGLHYFATDFVGHQANMEISLEHFKAAYGADQMFTRHLGKFYEY
ncbi:MAG TPA: endolytic transglycosylase MltG [Spirochaetia bacterium]|nr:endolytic transglycosylase MltG [Spirochaetia bacterium]